MRILVVRLDSLGDCILSSGFFVGLRKLFPAAHITLAIQKSSAPLFETSGIFDEIIRTDARGEIVSGSLTPPYDMSICPRWDIDDWNARQLSLSSEAPVQIGFDRGAYSRAEALDAPPSRPWTAAVHASPSQHEAEKGQNILKVLGAMKPMPPPRLFIPRKAAAAARRFRLRTHLNRYVLLGVSAASPKRIWPVENFDAVIAAICRQPDIRCVVVGGVDAEASASRLQDAHPGLVVSSAGKLDLMTSAALIAKAELYVGMDTGPMHLAAASRVPVVEISCHPEGGDLAHYNSPARFGPYLTKSRIIRPSSPRPPCTLGCEEMTSHCISQIEASTVVDAIQSLLAEKGQ